MACLFDGKLKVTQVWKTFCYQLNTHNNDNEPQRKKTYFRASAPR